MRIQPFRNWPSVFPGFTGDSFGAGLIYALRHGYTEQDAIEFAVAASCLKQTIEFDFNVVSTDEVLALKNGSGSGRVQR